MADPEQAVDVIRHHDEGVQRHGLSQFAGAFPFFSDDFSVSVEIHPAPFHVTEKGYALTGIRRDQVGAAAIVVVVFAEGTGAES